MGFCPIFNSSKLSLAHALEWEKMRGPCITSSEDEEGGNTPLNEWSFFQDMSQHLHCSSPHAPFPAPFLPKPTQSLGRADHQTQPFCVATQHFPNFKEFYCLLEGSSWLRPAALALAAQHFPSPKQKHPFWSPWAHPPAGPAASVHRSKKSICWLDNSNKLLLSAEHRRRCSFLLP